MKPEKVYLAGAMAVAQDDLGRDIMDPDNLAYFDKYANALRQMGHEVYSAAEQYRACPSMTRRQGMRLGLRELTYARTIALIPETWRQSRGVLHQELPMALALGLKIRCAYSWEDLEAAAMAATTAGRAKVAEPAILFRKLSAVGIHYDPVTATYNVDGHQPTRDLETALLWWKNLREA